MFVRTLVMRTHLSGAGSWLRRLVSRVAHPLLSAAGRLGKTGVVATITAALTDPTCRRLLGKAATVIGRGVGWLARKVYTGIDGGLRLFGRPGNRMADALFAGVVSLGGKMASVAAPVVRSGWGCGESTATGRRRCRLQLCRWSRS